MNRSLLLVLLLFLLMSVPLISTSATTAESEQPHDELGFHQAYFPTVANSSNVTNCRYGINLAYARGAEWLPTFGVGHYINFAVRPNGVNVPASTELLRQVRLEQIIEDGVYLPQIKTVPPLTMDNGGLGPLVLANPGGIWIVGNEPDVSHNQQDNMLPTTYAWAYNAVYNFIKGLDPTAQVANGGLSMMTPGRRQYLNIVWNTYLQAFGEEMPVDVWNMHLYILSEIRPWDGGNADGKVALGTNPDLALKAPYGPPAQECPKEDVYCRAEHDSVSIFREQILMMRQWMKNHGQTDKPLILSEFSILYPFVGYDDSVNPTVCYLKDEFGRCFTPERVINYMHQTLDYLDSARDPELGYPADDYRLVQQWAWFSMWTGQQNSGSSSNLLFENYTDFAPPDPSALTEVGSAYRNRVLSQKTTVNLVAAKASDVTVQAANPEGTADVPITLDFYNNGSRYIDKPFVVVFFADDLLQEVIGGVRVSPKETGIIKGCSWGWITNQASVMWKDVPTGTHTYWAKVDGPNDIGGEVNEGDNVVTGQVTVLPQTSP